jgi:hypothetical protein
MSQPFDMRTFTNNLLRGPSIDKNMEDMKGIIKALDPKGEIKVTRTEALEFWDRARIANKRKREGG